MTNWNPITRYLARHRRAATARKHIESEDQAAELERMKRLFAENPGLHARIILQGVPGIHYIDAVDLAALETIIGDQPEMKCRWN